MSSIEAARIIGQQIQILAKDARSSDLRMTIAALEFAAFVIQQDVDRISQSGDGIAEPKPDALRASGG